MTKTLNIPAFDHAGVNAILRGIEAELGARAAKRRKKLDALVIGGGRLDQAGEDDLTRFACEKNWHILYATMDEARPSETLAACNLEISYFCTDGVSRTAVLRGGRLWKRDRQAQARLLFPAYETEVKAKADGLLYNRPVAAPYHDHDFDLARQSIEKRMAAAQPSPAMLTSIGETLVVHDMQTMLRLLAGE